MKNHKYTPQQILIEEAVAKQPLTRQILANLSGVPTRFIPDAEDVILSARQSSDFQAETLLLAKQRGPFLRLCPGTPKHICCLYQNLDVMTGCNLECSYCILQGYLNNPFVTIYTNLDDMFLELEYALTKHPGRFFRIGTGELTDSLTFDHITELCRDLVPYFAEKKNAILELKTKSVQVDHLIKLEHNRRVVISWSLNAEPIIAAEEPLTPTLDERLQAMREVQAAGYRLGFHFDPIIEYEGWQDGYRTVVDKLFQIAKPENIAWISLGALRYPPHLDDIIRQRHPHSRIVLGELLPGIDRKLRYFKTIRIEMFRKMAQWIKAISQDVFVYLCMESDEVWRRAFGWSPGKSATLAKLLDERVKW